MSSNWTKNDWLGLLSLIVAIVGLFVVIFAPDLHDYFILKGWRLLEFGITVLAAGISIYFLWIHHASRILRYLAAVTASAVFLAIIAFGIGMGIGHVLRRIPQPNPQLQPPPRPQPAPQTFLLRVRILAADIAVKKGSIAIIDSHLSAPVAEGGEADFKEFPREAIGQTVEFVPHVSGYKRRSESYKVQVSESGVDLRLERSAPLIVAGASPSWSVGATASQAFRVKGGNEPYTWSYSWSPAIASGLDFKSDNTTATVSGRPTIRGSFRLSIQVTDDDGALSGNEIVDVNVTSPPIRITTNSQSQQPGQQQLPVQQPPTQPGEQPSPTQPPTSPPPAVFQLQVGTGGSVVVQQLLSDVAKCTPGALDQVARVKVVSRDDPYNVRLECRTSCYDSKPESVGIALVRNDGVGLWEYSVKFSNPALNDISKKAEDACNGYGGLMYNKELILATFRK